MRLATIKLQHSEVAAIVLADGVLPIPALNKATGAHWDDTVIGLIKAEQLPGLTEWYNNADPASLPGIFPFRKVVYAPLYRMPPHIFGIGLNYADHARDIGAPPPAGFPGSFFKEPEILIGYGETRGLQKLIATEAVAGLITIRNGAVFNENPPPSSLEDTFNVRYELVNKDNLEDYKSVIGVGM